MVDRTVKALLLAIAVGIWVLILTLWFLPPADNTDQVLQELQDVHEDVEELHERMLDLLEPADAPDDQPRPSRGDGSRAPHPNGRKLQAAAAAIE
ncbi:MAG: hypothetical protein AB7O32_11460 [Vicinamibacterales bacterium]